MQMLEFQELVWEYYRANGRDLPWRQRETDGTFDVYKIMVSEIMLQQTQAPRVVPKYKSFLKRFPDVQSLADAPLAEVLGEWSGLGYNRRAKYLQEAAKQLVGKKQPWSLEDLVACKGIGYNTAAAVVTYAYDQPVPFIETNVRTVYIHHFFADKEGVDDKDILPLVEETLDHEHPREWCWALMDYGVQLKRTVGNASRSSKHYTKQSEFHGSKRQIRGQVLRLLGSGSRNQTQLTQAITDKRLGAVLKDLLSDGLITKQGGSYRLG
jgi:A/G-specific adenine glycosylase